LRDSGHEVRVTFDPATALSAIEDFAPDYAVVDIGLPVMDGYELVDKLRERLGSGHCRYIALSGYGQAADCAKSIDAGFLMHLVKPVDPDALVAVIGRDLQDVHPRAVGQPSTAPA
jgi:CheY-like chemotaxis protein